MMRLRLQNNFAITIILFMLSPQASLAAAPLPAKTPTLWLEEMTSPEVHDFIETGGKTVLIPTGGTEQNGPHMALGKHNFILRHTAYKIASQLGATLIAPVMPYVPEGDIAPPTGHMRFAGTLSISEATFAAWLEETARSLKAHGFTLICFLGDSGGNQAAQESIAKKLSEEWKEADVRVLHVSDYYSANNQEPWLLEQGFSKDELNGHAALEDTSELLATHPEAVRKSLLQKADEGLQTGSSGHAVKAKPELGEKLLDLKIAAALQQIRAARGY